MLFMCERVFLSLFTIRNLPELTETYTMANKIRLFRILFTYLLCAKNTGNFSTDHPVYFRNALESFVTGIKLLPFATNAPL